MDFHNALDDVEEENEYMYGGRDGVIFLVDASEPMFVKEQGSDGETPFKTCMECCKTFMLSKIISSDRDVVSIVLFGTSKSANELSAPNITTMQDLSEPSAVKIKQLEKMLESDDLDGFEDKYGHSNDFTLSDALWLCQTIFATSAHKTSSQRVLLLTNTSNPHPGASASRRQVLVRAADLAQAGIALELLHMGAGFDTALFYQELVTLARGGGDDEDDVPLADPTARIDELLERVCRLHYRKRALCKLTLHLGPGASLGVNMYNLTRKTKLPTRINLDRSTNEPVTSVTRYYNPVTGETMLPAELCKSQTFGDKEVLFRPDELRQLRAMSAPGIQLLGFKPADRVKVHHHMRPAAFLYPDEALVKGGRALFAALLSRCLARSVVPVCYLTARINATPHLVALVPQDEKLSRCGREQRRPPGFHVVYLPYADSVRRLSLGAGRAGAEAVARAAAVLDKLRFRYRPSLLDNPRLQVHWANVEALALDHAEPRAVPDYTVPNYADMRGKLGALAAQLLREVYEPGYDPEGPAARAQAVKREGGGPAARAPAVKREGGDPAGAQPHPKAAKQAVDHAYVIDLHRAHKLSSLTVTQLKTYLEAENVSFPKTAKKAALVEIVQDYLQ